MMLFEVKKFTFLSIYIKCDFCTTTWEEEDISLEGQVVPRKDTFRYLESMLQRDGDIDEDVSHRIKAGG